MRKGYAELAGFGKPIMIAELGTLAHGGDEAGWYEAALSGLVQHYPRIQALVFFHVAWDTTVAGQPLDWSFASEPDVVSSVRRALGTWRPRG